MVYFTNFKTGFILTTKNVITIWKQSPMHKYFKNFVSNSILKTKDFKKNPSNAILFKYSVNPIEKKLWPQSTSFSLGETWGSWGWPQKIFPKNAWNVFTNVLCESPSSKSEQVMGLAHGRKKRRKTGKWAKKRGKTGEKREGGTNSDLGRRSPALALLPRNEKLPRKFPRARTKK